ncbi:MAG: alpha/beta fold hydrolase [Ramlibacter sp.]
MAAPVRGAQGSGYARAHRDLPRALRPERLQLGNGRWAAQFGAQHGSFASERADGYRKLAMPLMLVWGAMDTITPPAQAEAIAKLAPRAWLVMLPGVGHIPQIEDPALLNRRAADVLGRHAALKKSLITIPVGLIRRT